MIWGFVRYSIMRALALSSDVPLASALRRFSISFMQAAKVSEAKASSSQQYSWMSRSRMVFLRLEAMFVCISILRFFSSISGNAFITPTKPDTRPPEPSPESSLLISCRLRPYSVTVSVKAVETRSVTSGKSFPACVSQK